MAYQVLARKWRPQNFHSMVGQEHVLRALINALDEERLHHAYLFAGTRGVGKTTIARILARCLNCEQGVSSTPCGVCPSCVEITEGRFVDLIEVDAASRTKVEDTRELLDNVQYAPTRGRFKVYLIDEVHMLSTSSFNALLKTLEEPPPHVKFLLATTDPQKLPITVLSRCLQFNLKNMPAEQVAGHLNTVLSSENIAFEEASLWQLGRAAKGSMRDALSLTDQAIAFCGGNLSESAVNQMLGSIDQGTVLAIVSALQKGDASELLTLIGKLGEQGQDFIVALEDLLSLLHQIAICQVLPDAPVSVQFDKANVIALAKDTDPSDVQLFYQMGVMARKDMEAAPDVQAGFEMALLRMLAFRPQQHAGQRQNIEPANQAQAQAQPQPQVAVKTPVTPEQAVINTPYEPATENLQLEELKASGAAEQTQAQAEQTEVEQTQVEQSSNQLPVDESPPWADEPVSHHNYDSEYQPITHQAPSEGPTQAFNSEVSHTKPMAARAEASEPAPDPEPEPGLLQDSVHQAHPESITTQPAPKVSRKDWTLADLTPEAWVNAFNDLGLVGMTHSIAANMVFDSRQGTHLKFTLDHGQSSMLNEAHTDRIKSALEAMFECDLQVTISIGQTQIETPFASRQRREAQHLASALESLQNDPNVESLITAFNGQLDATSVVPVKPIEH